MDAQQIGICVSLAGTLVSLLTSGYAIRQGRAANLRQRTADAAYFNFGRLLVQRPWRDDDHNKMKIMAEPYPLGEFGKVPDDYPDGWVVAMCATNKGKEARKVQVDAGPDLEIGLHGFGVGADDLGHVDSGEEITIIYRFKVTRRGTREKFRIRFETPSGDKITQKFAFTHGLLKIERL